MKIHHFQDKKVVKINLEMVANRVVFNASRDAFLLRQA